MSFDLHLWMLFGLAALIIPPLIHLLNRRRYNVVDWGAMQFLQVSETTRRRLLIEEILLMLLRMGLIALLVLGLAAPRLFLPPDSPVGAVLGGGHQPARDVVLVFDGSYSMGFSDGKSKAPHAAAREWALKFLETLGPNDRVAVLQAKQQVVPLLPRLTRDNLEQACEAATQFAALRGGCDWPRALRHADKILADQGRGGPREIVLLTDGQKYGWADAATLGHWKKLGNYLRAVRTEKAAADPRVRVVNVAPARPDDPPNYALAPLTTTRAVAWSGQRLQFKTAIVVSGAQQYTPPYGVRLEVDGKPVAALQPPPRDPLARGQVPLTFRHRFDKPGSHLVSVVLEPDLPEGKRPQGYQLRDTLPGDNRQDLAVEVVGALPVLLVDGDSRLGPESSTHFLSKALGALPYGKNLPLAPGPDDRPREPPVVLARVVPAKDFDPEMLRRDLDVKKPGSRPRALVLADVPHLTPVQEEAVATFVQNGGGVLVALGERVENETAFYNERLYRDGRGWLPARLEQLAGDERKRDLAASPDLRQFHHPSLALFREEPNCTLGKARFPRWWKVSTPPGQTASVPVALLTTGDPLLVEKSYRNGGRVLLCTVPLDRAWGGDLPLALEFPVLAHELLYTLAAASAAEHNLKAGEPILYRLPPALAEAGATPPTLLLVESPEGDLRVFPYAAAQNGEDAAGVGALPKEVVRQGPDGQERRLKVEPRPLQDEGPRDTGVYRVWPARHGPGTAGGDRLTLLDEKGAYYVVQPDPGESKLTPATKEDRDKVAALVPLEYRDELRRESVPHKLWWWLLLGVVLLLCGEVWMTRRMVKGRESR